MENNHNSQLVSAFHKLARLEQTASPVGYAALIEKFGLSVPLPDSLCAISVRHKKTSQGMWNLFTPRHSPEQTLYGHLTFALKYEGVDLAVLKSLFNAVGSQEITSIILSEPTGSYSRRIWFLYEWLLNTTLDITSATQGNFVELLNDKLQYVATSRDSKRHRIRNNLPGTRHFCPLIRRTETLDRYIAMQLSQTAKDHLGKTLSDLLARAASFLLLKDSKASYSIEGEKPAQSRITRWGKIIGEAGQRQLNVAELEYLQSIVIADNRFVTPGCRIEGGFVGEHDRATGMPIPVHISAKVDDLNELMNGFIETSHLLIDSRFDAVLAAAIIAFGFVFIHPFEDGNGRIHRYLFHHILADKKFVPKGMVFPISAVILEKLDEYRKSLEHYSLPRLDFIEWRPTAKNNVEVLNDTIDLYRYFDATKQAEFLFECVEITVKQTLPEEVDYLTKYDLFANFINNYIDMPNKLLNLLVQFLNHNNGKLSKRAKDKEFSALTDAEVTVIEEKYHDIFQKKGD